MSTENRYQVTAVAEEHLRRMRATAAARFNAAKRLEDRDVRLTRLTAFTSAYVVVLTVLPYFLHLPPPKADWSNLFTVTCAVIILIASLLQNASGAVVAAEQHHRSGLEISEIWRELECRMGELDRSALKEYLSRYDAVLQKYSINHDDLDYQRYQLERPELFPHLTGRAKFTIWCRLTFTKHIPSLTLLTLTTLLLATIVGFGVPPSTAANRPGSATDGRQ